jgi:hypothetical protein
MMMFKKKNTKNHRIVNIDKEKYEINSLHVYSCYDFICKELHQFTSGTPYIPQKKKTKLTNVIIAP